MNDARRAKSGFVHLEGGEDAVALHGIIVTVRFGAVKAMVVS